MSFTIKKSPNARGQGLFTNRAFDSNAVVFKFEGKIITIDELNANYTKDQQADVLQIGKQLYLDLFNENWHFVNHSCNPNCYVKVAVNNAFLISTRPIAKGEELTFDYSLGSSDTPDEWNLQCFCHRFYCRKEVSGFYSLPKEKQDEAIKKGWVPNYILKELNVKN